MLRVILVNIVLFFLPFALYCSFRLLTRVDDGRANVLEGLPLLPLALIGTALIAVTLGVTATLTEKRQGTYEPPVIVDGKVQPGRIK